MKNTRIIHSLIWLIMLSVFLVIGCSKTDNNNFTDSPIVEAYLIPGQEFHISLSRQLPFSSDVTYSTDNINQLDMIVAHRNTTYHLASTGEGIYSNPSLIVAEGDTFDLQFGFNGKTVKAFTYIPPKPDSISQSVSKIYLAKIDSTSGFPGAGGMPEPVEISWSNSDNSYYLIIVENTEEDPEPVRDFDQNEDRPSFVFRKAPTSNNSEMLRPMEFEYFGMHRIILFHVLPDYAALYDQNSTSSLNLTNPSTSITNGYGIFTGLSSDTLFLDVKKK